MELVLQGTPGLLCQDHLALYKTLFASLIYHILIDFFNSRLIIDYLLQS